MLCYVMLCYVMLCYVCMYVLLNIYIYIYFLTIYIYIHIRTHTHTHIYIYIYINIIVYYQRKLGSNTSVLRTNLVRLDIVKGGVCVCVSFASHNNTSQKNNRLWHRVVWDLTPNHNTSQKNKRLWHRVVTKGSGEEGKWRRREVVRKGSGD